MFELILFTQKCRIMGQENTTVSEVRYCRYYVKKQYFSPSMPWFRWNSAFVMWGYTRWYLPIWGWHTRGCSRGITICTSVEILAVSEAVRRGCDGNWYLRLPQEGKPVNQICWGLSLTNDWLQREQGWSVCFADDVCKILDHIIGSGTYGSSRRHVSNGSAT